MNSRFSKYFEAGILCIFAILAIIMLAVNRDFLYAASNQSLFLKGTVFFADCMRYVGGGLNWLGLVGTTLFHYPALGIALLLFIWILIYLLLRHTFALPQMWRWCYLLPIAALLASIVGVGYWLFYMKMPGYWVRESVGLLAVLLLLQADRGKFRWVAAPLMAACYPLIGWYATLALLLLAIRQLLRSQWIEGGIAIALLIFVPRLVAACYSTIRLEDAWLAQFPSANYLTSSASVITRSFVTIVISLIALCGLSHFQPKRWGLPIGLSLIVATIYGLCRVNVSDHNFHAELRMYRALQEERWDDVLQEMKDAPEGPTRQMVCCKNVALLHKGTLLEEMFKYENNGPSPLVPDTLNIHMAQTIAPMLYLYHGMANDATHWAIENSVEYGLTLDRIQILVQAALVSGETRLAAKYLDMLSLAPFQQDFVKRHVVLMQQPELIAKDKKLALMRLLHEDLLCGSTSDEGQVEWNIYRSYANYLGYRSRQAQEVALTYAMTLKDYDMIWPQLFGYCNFVHNAKEIPVPVQEAAYMGMKRHPLGDNTQFNFDPSIAKHYDAFHSRRKPANDHSYWYFYYFCNDAHTY